MPLSSTQLTQLQSQLSKGVTDAAAASESLTQLDDVVFATPINPAAVRDDGANVAFAVTAVTNDIVALRASIGNLVADAPPPTGTQPAPPVVVPPTPPVTPPVTTPVPVSSVPALFVPSQTQSAAAALAKTLGIPLTGLSGYGDGSTWNSIANGWVPSVSGIPLYFGVDLTPNNTGDSVIPPAGTWTALGKRLPDHTVVRIGWEPDIATGPWGLTSKVSPANTPALYVTRFRACALELKAANPTLKVDFSVNTGTSSLSQLEALYPGDDVVDYIGGDHYDNPQGNGDFSQFLNIVTLAVNHGKPVSGGEIGLNGHDNPQFIFYFAEFVLDPTAAAKRYKMPVYVPGPFSYFSDKLATDSDITTKPNSIAEFKGCFGSPATISV